MCLLESGPSAVAAAYARSAIQKMYDMIKLATAELVQFDSLPLPKDS